MGYKVKKTIYTLKFEDPDYEGIVVRVRAGSMGSFLDVMGLAGMDLMEGADVTIDDMMAGASEVDALFKQFIALVLEWNLEDEDTGEPIPTTVEGLRSLELPFVMTLVGAWMDAMKGTTPGLPQPSGSGPQSLEASIPMEELSLSRQSLREPA